MSIKSIILKIIELTLYINVEVLKCLKNIFNYYKIF